jgi:hypothetical protein
MLPPIQPEQRYVERGWKTALTDDAGTGLINLIPTKCSV